MSGGGGGGGGGGMTQSPNVPAAGPPRAVGSYPQYNPLAYMGMTPGAQGAMPGMGAPIASYMPAVNGMNGFGGIPAAQLVRALMAGYAGVPSATQATGAMAPGMGTMQPTAGATTGTPTTPADRIDRTRAGRRRGGNVGPLDQGGYYDPTDYASGSAGG